MNFSDRMNAIYQLNSLKWLSRFQLFIWGKKFWS